MRKIYYIILLLILISVNIISQTQTSEFSRIIRNIIGNPQGGLNVDLYDDNTSNKLYDLTEDSKIPGRYYHPTVSHGLYDLCVNGAFKQGDIWHGGNKLSIIADNFDGSGNILTLTDNLVDTDHIDDSTIILYDLSIALKNYINAAGGGSIVNQPDDVSIENKTDTTLGVKQSWIEGEIDVTKAAMRIEINDSLGVHDVAMRVEIEDSIAAHSLAAPEEISLVMSIDSLWYVTTLGATIDTLNTYSNIVNIKTPGAVGDGVTNDKTAIDNAFANLLSLGGGSLIIPDGTYLYTGQMNLDLESKNITIAAGNNAVILLDDKTRTYDILDTAAVWKFHGGNKVIIKNVHFKATNYNEIPQASGNFLNAILIYDCNTVNINNIEIDSAMYAGLRIIGVKKLTITNSIFRYNLYAGIYVNNISQMNIEGNEFSYNGIVNANYA